MTEGSQEQQGEPEATTGGRGTRPHPRAPRPRQTLLRPRRRAASDDVAKLRRENANRRGALREVEAERDALRDQVAALQRAEVERLAAERLADPSDLWRHDGVELDALLGEDGGLDAERWPPPWPGWSRRTPHGASRGPTSAPGPGAASSPRPTFGEAFKRAGRAGR